VTLALPIRILDTWPTGNLHYFELEEQFLRPPTIGMMVVKVHGVLRWMEMEGALPSHRLLFPVGVVAVRDIFPARTASVIGIGTGIGTEISTTTGTGTAVIVIAIGTGEEIIVDVGGSEELLGIINIRDQGFRRRAQFLLIRQVPLEIVSRPRNLLSLSRPLRVKSACILPLLLLLLENLLPPGLCLSQVPTIVASSRPELMISAQERRRHPLAR
jgi:hypothetical protein